MAKTLGTLSFKTPIQDIGITMIETGQPVLNTPIAGGKIATHLWTSDTTGGTVIYTTVAGTTATLYLARELGIMPIAFVKITGGTLAIGTIWWGRTANHMILEQV